MLAPPSEAVSLPEFSTDSLEHIAYTPKERGSPISEALFAPGVDPWPVIQETLTARQFQAFEFAYRYQMNQTEIAKVMNIKAQSVQLLLDGAKKRLRQKGEENA